MQTTYQISRGQQYDPSGATVVYGHHDALVASYAADGTLDHGIMPAVADHAELGLAVRRVIATGLAETITIGEPEIVTHRAIQQTGVLVGRYGTCNPADCDGLPDCNGDCSL